MATIMMSDDISEPSSPESTPFDDADLLNNQPDDVTMQLAAAGPIGVAAAAAIATGKKRKRPHSFETNPSIRKRQQTRLLRKLKATIDEYTTRVGQQACVIVCSPGKPNSSFKVFGAAPLENVVRNCRNVIMSELENALAQQAPAPPPENSNLHELPPLVIDGIPTPVDKMTQAQLRAFIPMMLKYSTGRGKPGWGKESCRPVWWPSDLPWANVRSDARSEDQKQKVSWTHALRTIVKNCYKHHGREDLLIEFTEDTPATQQQHTQHIVQPHTVLQTINNPDGTVSLIQVDPGTSVATLTADVAITHQHNSNSQAEATQAVATLAEVAAATQSEVALPQAPQATPVSVDINSAAAAEAVATLAEATLSEGGHIMLSGDAAAAVGALAGVHDASSQGGMVTIPVSMYQTVVTSIANSQQHHQQHQTHHAQQQQPQQPQQQQQQQQQQQHQQQHAGHHEQSQEQHQQRQESIPQVAMVPNTTQASDMDHSDVPVATHAVEVVTLEQAQ
ncbi:DNA-binding protein P3A2-like isoform X2 [Ptychodera flava]